MHKRLYAVAAAAFFFFLPLQILRVYIYVEVAYSLEFLSDSMTRADRGRSFVQSIAGK